MLRRGFAGSAHRTRNRVPQYPHVATPKRSTPFGGAPQFGHGISIAPRGAAAGLCGGGCMVGGGGGISGFVPGSANAKTAPPANRIPKPAIATITGWTTSLTAAITGPNMKTKNPMKIRAIPATFAGWCRGPEGRTYGTGGGWNACATGCRAPASLDEFSGAVPADDFRGLPALQFLQHRGQELEDVRREPDVGDLEDRRGRVRVDRD